MATVYSSMPMTGIDKRPVSGPVQVAAPGPRGVGGSGLDGDTVCELRHHGGDHQAVYVYTSEDYAYFGALLGRSLRPGMFGDNLTTVGVNVNDTVVGETWQIGDELLLQVSDPRIPCRTFAGWLGEQGWIRRFTQEARSGTYFRVLRPGPVRAGGEIVVRDRPDHGVTVRTAFRALTTHPELLPELLPVTALAPRTQKMVRRRCASGQTQGLHPLGVSELQSAE